MLNNFANRLIAFIDINHTFHYDDSFQSNQTFFYVGNVSFCFQDAWKKLTDTHLFNAKHQLDYYQNSKRIAFH